MSSLDKSIIARIEGKRSAGHFSSDELDFADCPLLLKIVLSVHSPLLSLDLKQCEDYLFEFNIIPLLKNAYALKSFSTLLDHQLICELRNSKKDAITGSVPLAKSSSNGSVKTAFEEPYQGDVPQCFIDTLDTYSKLCEAESSANLYNRSISVIQSSGMGKSRMVDAVANEVFTIPANLREKVDKALRPYPPPDEVLRSYFENHKSKSDHQLQGEYAILLKCIFETVVSQFPKIVWKADNRAGIWADHLRSGENDLSVGNNRREFYTTAVNAANEGIRKIKEAGDNQVDWSAQLESLFAALQSSAKRMLAVVAPGHSGEGNACLVYFDEAHDLAKPPGVTEDVQHLRTPYHNLGSVLAYLRDLPIFFIFLSTNSHLEQFAPPSKHHPSARASHPGSFLIPPFTELPFNIFVKQAIRNLSVSNKSLSLANACTMQVMSSMGRPMWFVHNKLWEAQQAPDPQQTSGPESKVEHITMLAVNKLTAQGIPEHARESELAALSVRIGINFESTAASRDMECKQVESHLRIVYAIPQHREFMRTGSPSEPVLAEAAAAYLNRIHNGIGIAIVGPRILSKNCKKGFVARGERGELCGRLLMIIAHDLALLDTPDETLRLLKDPKVKFHRPVPVLVFLRALFADMHHATILEATPVTDDAGEKLQDAFKEAYVCFSHFALAGDSAMLDVWSLRNALFRGMAMQAKDNQESIDAVIPIHMGPITSPITTQTTSAINLQFKNRKQSRRCFVDRSITVPDFKQPVISIVFELGERLPELPEAKLKQLVRSHHSSPLGSRNEGDESTLHPDDHHYLFVARGCGPNTYKAIPEEVKMCYDIILASGDLKDDFPRNHNQISWRIVQELTPAHYSLKSKTEWEEWESIISSGPLALSGAKRSVKDATSVNTFNDGSGLYADGTLKTIKGTLLMTDDTFIKL
ncbi:unnamed protein product [Rhizoctonia solani]|uniref:Uncharacterized protein n=1 Tax=Rhizoctonia solani TaxID=456999 RepID=A0A8H3DHK8_9AGAM|nr:unnamed protein product [Rhizoctonia solani]